MAPTTKAQSLPPSAFAEPSEPAARAPSENSKAQLTNPQEENPQAVMKRGAAKKEDRKHGPGEGEEPPPSAFAEQSEPSHGTPGENPREQITSAQEENPQAVVKAKL